MKIEQQLKELVTVAASLCQPAAGLVLSEELLCQLVTSDSVAAAVVVEFVD